MRPQPTDRHAASRATSKARARELEGHRTDDTEYLRSQGNTPHTVAARVGFPTVSAAARYFYRKNRPDLANWFENDRDRKRS